MAWLSPRLPDRERTRILGLAVLVGAIGGLSAVTFELAMEAIGILVLGTSEPSITDIPPWRAIVGAIAASVVCGWVGYRLTSHGRPQGIPDVIEAVRLKRPLSWRDGLASAGAALLAIGGGQSAGREGPIVQVGATVASLIGARLHVSPSTARALTAAGAAAGIAASFNSPLGGAFFAMETVLGTFALDAFAPVVVASVTGTVVGQLMLGDRLALQLPPMHMESLSELLMYPILGIACGAVTVALRGTLRLSSARLSALPLPPELRPLLSGVLVGVLAAVGLPHVMGNGYPLMQEVISGKVVLGTGMLALILVAKIAASALAYGGRSGGGMFAPTLFLGAITGELVGSIGHQLAPMLVPDTGMLAVVGMGAVAAAAAHAPVTMALMIAEMTGNYAIILPLLVAIAIATVIANAADRHSLYVQALVDRGVRLEPSQGDAVPKDLTVRDVMLDRGFVAVASELGTEALAKLFLERRQDEVFVVGGTGVVGRVAIQDVDAQLREPDARRTTAASLARTLPSFRDHDPVSALLDSFARTGFDLAPVLDDTGRLVGIATDRSVFAGLNRAILRRDTQLESGAADDRRTDPVALPDGFEVATLDIGSAAGLCLEDLDLPRRLGVTVLAVDGWSEADQQFVRRPPSAAVRFGPRDRLVVIGPTEKLAALRSAVCPLVAEPVAATAEAVVATDVTKPPSVDGV